MSDLTLPDLVAAFTGEQDAHVLLVSGDERLARALDALDGVVLTWISNAVSAADIDIGLRVDVAVVSGQLETMDTHEGIHLLCRLRDCTCDCIFLELLDDSPSAQELLAIGFYRDESSPVQGRRFRYDRSSFFEPRQWNTPENWAHPEKFRKNRW